MPRRFRYWSGIISTWIYGVYFPTNSLTICENGEQFVGTLHIERKTSFEWIDQEGVDGT